MKANRLKAKRIIVNLPKIKLLTADLLIILDVTCFSVKRFITCYAPISGYENAVFCNQFMGVEVIVYVRIDFATERQVNKLRNYKNGWEPIKLTIILDIST